jgi:predicted Zn-ribbon and HTH transcriptional regulator
MPGPNELHTLAAPEMADEVLRKIHPLTPALMAMLAKLNTDEPPDHTPPPFLGSFRHRCPAQRNVSKPIDLREKYLYPSTEMAATTNSTTPAALIYREGKCKKCGQTARSTSGTVTNPDSRPPIEGRVAR